MYRRKCNSALAHPTNGVIILPTVISYARMFARLAIGLDKRPELIAHLVRKASFEDDGARETLPERAANILRQAFVTCLNDRTPTASGTRGGKPDGKKSGIYKIANLCLKILFQVRNQVYSIRHVRVLMHYSAIKAAMASKYLPIFTINHLLCLYTQLLSGSHIFTTLDASCSLVITSMPRSSLFKQPTTNVSQAPNAYANAA